jgi:hypothetical protein
MSFASVEVSVQRGFGKEQAAGFLLPCLPSVSSQCVEGISVIK